MKTGGKNKCCVYNFVQCVCVYIYIYIYPYNNAIKFAYVLNNL